MNATDTLLASALKTTRASLTLPATRPREDEEDRQSHAEKDRHKACQLSTPQPTLDLP